MVNLQTRCMVETAIFAQWMHDEGSPLFYARWESGEIDIVYLNEVDVSWCVEVKWSNRYAENPAELKSLRSFAKKHKLQSPTITTIDIDKIAIYDGLSLSFIPASLYCYTVARNLVSGKFGRNSMSEYFDESNIANLQIIKSID